MGSDRLGDQIRFILEIDKLKGVLRRTYLADGSRRENSAEHSWHVAVMAAVLAEHANEPVNVGRVVRMLLVHDIVEVDAGDTFVYDPVGAVSKGERERAAADRIFGLLPPDQGRELRGLWEEFEAAVTPDARFAAALDRTMPVLHNIHTQGRAWRENRVTADMVIARNSRIADGSRELWEYVRALIERAVESGHLAPAPG
ncbi:MAG TPA: HD domain-containing protein [Thermoanaerobaculaceae bacterium]|nr:HD domain-containing protein [Thermoanaerobaculaceae bacterium]